MGRYRRQEEAIDRARFDHIDVVHGNGDHHISLTEFLAHFEEVHATAERKAELHDTWRSTFTMMDSNRDGKLNRNEFHWHDRPWKEDDVEEL